MEDSAKIKQKFELLKMARELLNEDYINRRAEDHNKWVAENDEEWRIKRRTIPYPPFAQYPTDDEIVKVASNLYKFIYESEKEPEEFRMPLSTTETDTDAEITQDNGIILTEVESPISLPPPTLEPVISSPLEDNESHDEDTAVKKLLPRWAKRFGS